MGMTVTPTAVLAANPVPKAVKPGLLTVFSCSSSSSCSRAVSLTPLSSACICCMRSCAPRQLIAQVSRQLVRLVSLLLQPLLVLQRQHKLQSQHRKS